MSRTLCLIPAYNEAGSLPAVVEELRAWSPDLDVLVVDDGSNDGTTVLLSRLGVRWLRFPERMGIGSAIRAGLRFATRLGYDTVVRTDGDGQHAARDIDDVLAPILARDADVVLGSRYKAGDRASVSPASFARRSLAACLSVLTNDAVTDPTSGFCAFGPRAMELLAEHHPTGYPEPELRLLLSRNRLRVVEVPVRERARLAGRTSLTPARVTAASARVALAMLVVPLRCRIEVAGRD